ncbi:hypothetical protein ANN_14706 [Periplaneta americana]|uniref:Uncharacterized protein n=1 Tax=Periplaneta americana TaxID=6978 RepID=A0ABQ8SYH9_PERAM|nr:hypothetical protein ANN_14706 [Periplaneta americana]
MCHGSLYAVMWLADEPREFNLSTLPQRCITNEVEKLPSKYGVHSEEYCLRGDFNDDDDDDDDDDSDGGNCVVCETELSKPTVVLEAHTQVSGRAGNSSTVLRLRWAGHVASMGESRNVYRVLVGRPEGKRPLGRPRRRWEDKIKMDLREVGYDGRDWINLAQDRDQWWAYVRAAMNLRIVYAAGSPHESLCDMPFPYRGDTDSNEGLFQLRGYDEQAARKRQKIGTRRQRCHNPGGPRNYAVKLMGFLELGKDAITLPPRGFDENLSILLNEGCDWLLTGEDKISVTVRKTFIYDNQLVVGSRRKNKDTEEKRREEKRREEKRREEKRREEKRREEKRGKGREERRGGKGREGTGREKRREEKRREEKRREEKRREEKRREEGRDERRGGERRGEERRGEERRGEEKRREEQREEKRREDGRDGTRGEERRGEERREECEFFSRTTRTCDMKGFAIQYAFYNKIITVIDVPVGAVFATSEAGV